MCRAKTAEEIREAFLDEIRTLVWYWSTVKLEPDRDTVDQRVSGIAFSILSTIDGGANGLPAFDLVACPCEEDKQYDIENGENWVEKGTIINECQLHELFYKKNGDS